MNFSDVPLWAPDKCPCEHLTSASVWAMTNIPYGVVNKYCTYESMYYGMLFDMIALKYGTTKLCIIYGIYFIAKTECFAD